MSSELDVSAPAGRAGAAPAIASLLCSATSWWLLSMFTALHWRVLFGAAREAVAGPAREVLFSQLGQLDIGYRLFALAAMAFNLWAFSRGRPRWAAIAVFPATAIALCTFPMLQ